MLVRSSLLLSAQTGSTVLWENIYITFFFNLSPIMGGKVSPLPVPLDAF